MAALEYGVEGAASCAVNLAGSRGETTLLLAGAEGRKEIDLPGEEGKPEQIRLRKQTAGVRLWIRVIPAEEGSGDA